jgi:hypothetical protein
MVKLGRAKVGIAANNLNLIGFFNIQPFPMNGLFEGMACFFGDSFAFLQGMFQYN